MQDDRGLYYHPHPGNSKVRVYVRHAGSGVVEFRMWQVDYPEVWEKHDWIPLDVIKNAAALYRQNSMAPSSGDPMILYDEKVAAALLREAGQM